MDIITQPYSIHKQIRFIIALYSSFASVSASDSGSTSLIPANVIFVIFVRSLSTSEALLTHASIALALSSLYFAQMIRICITLTFNCHFVLFLLYLPSFVIRGIVVNRMVGIIFT